MNCIKNIFRNTIIESFNGLANTFFNREFEFFHEITAVSGVIKAYEKGPQRTKACKDALKQVKIQNRFSYGDVKPIWRSTVSTGHQQFRSYF